tara:strand:- start:473 stop:910 length:438 start_codon:yes stop_codon:yes gene_type:complete
MSKIVFDVISKCNAVEKPMNILIHEFDIDTELEISKTGHNFYRLNMSGEDEDRFTENFFILPKQEVLFCFDYDLFIFKSGTIQQDLLQSIQQRFNLPLLVIDEACKDKELIQQNVIVTNIVNKDDENFVNDWTKLLDKTKEVYSQ